jgi:hypothetical protein
LAQQARNKRDKKLSRADELWQQVLEAGWWSHWHVGFEDPTVSPDDNLYGYNLLQLDQPPRDPRGPQFTVRHRSRLEGCND